MIFLIGGFFSLLIILNPLAVEIYPLIGNIYDDVISFYEKPDLDYIVKNIGFIGIFIGFSTFGTFIISLVYKYRKENDTDTIQLIMETVGITKVVLFICIFVLLIVFLISLYPLIIDRYIPELETQFNLIHPLYIITWLFLGFVIYIISFVFKCKVPFLSSFLLSFLWILFLVFG